jgi:predicted SAM-dependent methyltransferase
VNLKKIDVGCGSRKRVGFVGMDLIALPNVDIVHDMNLAPWPIDNDVVEEIIFDDVLEHSKDFLTILSEVYRVAKSGCVVKISVPHFSSDNMYTDPTHTTFFSKRSFNYFDKSLKHKHGFYLNSVNFKILKAEIHFAEYFIPDTEKRKFNLYKTLGIQYLANKFPRFYEKILAWILPAAEIYFELKVVK